MIEISQPSFRILEGLRLMPGGDALLNVALDDAGPALFTVRLRADGEEHSFTRSGAEVLNDLSVTGAELARIRFENDIVYWGLVPV